MSDKKQRMLVKRAVRDASKALARLAHLGADVCVGNLHGVRQHVHFLGCAAA